MATGSLPRTRRKRPGRYHHGDLRRALLHEGLRLIETRGVDALTIRAVGARLGVSRTALYRHFADKSALLAAICVEGFRMLRVALLDAWGSGGIAGFNAMGEAYIRFAAEHPSHYRVMFGAFVDKPADADFRQEAGGAFQALVDAIVSLQRSGAIRQDEPLQLARFIWAAVHGVSTLTIDRQFEGQGADTDAVIRYALERIRAAVEPPSS